MTYRLDLDNHPLDLHVKIQGHTHRDMEVNSRRTPTLMFDTPLQLAAKPESCLILMIIVVDIG